MEVNDEVPILEKEVQLEKFPGKGGWTFAPLPEIPNQKSHFGWKKVKGKIDDFEFHQYHLMPMGNGHLFLPVKASIRKFIKKEAGDWVKIIIFEDNASLQFPEVFLLCLKDEPQSYENFMKFSEKDQKKYIDWIFAGKSENIIVERMASAINNILKGQRLK